jgi:hypothetical protein
MILRICLTVFLLIIGSRICYSQTNDEELYLFNAKRLSLSKGLLPKDSVVQYLNRFKSTRLSSNGFSDLLFYMVYDSIGMEDIDSNTFMSLDSLRKSNQIYGYCEFIFAINTKTKNTYRLKGYEIIDFIEFYETEILDNKPKLHLTSKAIKAKYYIERLDLGCLYNNYIKRRKCCNIMCSPCIDKHKHIMVY